MRKVLMTIACNDYFRQYLPRVRENAAPYFDEVLTLTEADIPDDWNESHREIIHQIGYGAYSWKPTILLRQFEKMADGDFIMWMDATSLLLRSPQPMLDACASNGGVLAVRNWWLRNGEWTRRDTFVRMGCDEVRYWQASQVHATFMVFQKTQRAIALLKDWKYYCDDVECVRYGPSDAPNLPGYQDHRSDQSILSILLAKEGIAVAGDKQVLHVNPILRMRCHDLHAVPYVLESGRKSEPWEGYKHGD